MVILRIVVFMLFCFHSSNLWAVSVKVSADVEQKNLYENAPIPVTITVEHNPNDSVDISSFQLGKEPIQVELVRELKVTGKGELLLSVYRYQLLGIKKGLHVLPAVSVIVAGKTVRSIPSSYQVKEPSVAVPVKSTNKQNSVSSSNAQGPVILKLENIIEGPTTLYPGQKTVIGYRYLFNRDIEASKEVTPFLEANGLTKIGDRIVDNKTIDDVSVMEVRQQVQGEEPGDYTFGPSILEGYVYTSGPLGKRRYVQPALKTEAPAIVIHVKNFPVQDKPASFNGVVGTYTFKTTLLSSKTPTLGDEMTLAVDISGEGSLESVLLPELCCQPGMSGVFQLNDLPPAGTVDGKTKRFIVKLRPLTSTVKEIPSLEFSSFNPETGRYQVVRSHPIPIQVRVLAPPENSASKESPSPLPSSSEWQKKLMEPAPIEVEGNYPLVSADLRNLPFGNWWVLLLVPLGIILLIYQKQMHLFLRQREGVEKQETSEDVLLQAEQVSSDTAEFYHLIRRSLLMRLQEIEEIKEMPSVIDKLPKDGLAGDVRAFLLRIEAWRYSGQKLENAQWKEEGRQLFTRLNKEVKE